MVDNNISARISTATLNSTLLNFDNTITVNSKIGTGINSASLTSTLAGSLFVNNDQ